MKEPLNQQDATDAAASDGKRAFDHTEPVLPKDFRRIGIKLRETRESERERRPEVIRIASIPEKLPSQVEAKADVSLQAGVIKQHESSRAKNRRRLRSATQQQSVRRGFGEGDSRLVDRWVPDVSRLSTGRHSVDSVQNTRSDFVWLHGLPKPCTSLMIQRFFSGLDPQRILILLCNAGEFPSLDADHYSGPPRKKNMVDRYPPSDLRVLVRFANAPTAALAAERSKEVMMFQMPSHAGDDVEPNSLTGAAVAVTVVTKPVARAVEHLAVDGETLVPLDVTESNLRAKLDPIVVNVLWTTAIRELSLQGGDKSQWYPHLLERETSQRWNSDYVVRSYHETLMKDYERLLYRQPFLTLQDPELLHIDPVARLTLRAIATLQQEMEARERFAVQRRVLSGDL